MPIRLDLNDDIPAALGDGLNWATGELRQTLVDAPQEETPSGQLASQTDFRISLLESWTDYQASSAGTARANLGIGVFGASTSAATSLFEKTSSYAVRLLVTVDVLLPTVQLKDPITQLQYDDPSKFVAKHGTHFILARRRGATLIGLISIDTASREERRDLRVKLSASGALGSFSASGSATLSQSLESIVGSRIVSCYYAKKGGNFVIASNDWKTFLSATDSFPASVTQDNAFNRMLYIESYEYVSGISGALALSVRKSVLEQQFRLDDLGALLSKYQENLASARYVIERPDRFSSADFDSMRESADRLAKAIQAIRREAERVAIDIDYLPKLFEIPAFVLPIEQQTAAPQPAPIPASAPIITCYTGPSQTGQAFQFAEGASDFPPGLNDRMKSFVIQGDFRPNTYWITFYMNGNQDRSIQTFVTKNVVSTFTQPDSTYTEFDIALGKETPKKLAQSLAQASSVRIWRNPDDTVQPNGTNMNLYLTLEQINYVPTPGPMY